MTIVVVRDRGAATDVATGVIAVLVGAVEVFGLVLDTFSCTFLCLYFTFCSLLFAIGLQIKELYSQGIVAISN